MAVVAAARKLVTIAWHMLKNNEPYRYAQPRTTEAKMSRLRVRATGQRRKGGNPKGQPRTPVYGTGQSTRAVPSLDQIYAKEQLPALAPQLPGELKMLERFGLTEYAEKLRLAHRIPRKSEKVDPA